MHQCETIHDMASEMIRVHNVILVVGFSKLLKFVQSLYNVFVELHFTYLEINPLGKFIPNSGSVRFGSSQLNR